MLNLEELKKEYIGKEFSCLTVIDVIRENKAIKFVCQCKCGKTHIARYSKVLSGNTKSCGCYHSSKEKSALYSEWCKDNPEKVRARSEKYSQWCKDNPDKLADRGKKHSQFYSDNPEVGAAAGRKYSKWCKENPEKVVKKTAKRKKTYEEHPEIQLNTNKKLSIYYKDNPDKLNYIINSKSESCRMLRISIDYSRLIDVIHPDYVELLINGNIKADSMVKTKCPVCACYAEHKFNNIYRLSKADFKNGSVPLCSNCRNMYNSSKTEQEISEFISTFYSGKCIRNTRYVIAPLELDLYYPEKKIAIEFNGDYWHSEEFKDKEYHYNKFKQCLESNILLVNIFETFWNSNKDLVKSYLYDLFKGIVNKLSYIDNSYTDNNFPQPDISINTVNYIESYYTFRNCRVYTAGYSLISKI